MTCLECEGPKFESQHQTTTLQPPGSSRVTSLKTSVNITESLQLPQYLLYLSLAWPLQLLCYLGAETISLTKTHSSTRYGAYKMQKLPEIGLRSNAKQASSSSAVRHPSSRYNMGVISASADRNNQSPVSQV